MKIKDDHVLKIVNVKIKHPKNQLQNMIELIEEAFCFDEPEGNKEVIEVGKLLIKYIKTQDKYKKMWFKLYHKYDGKVINAIVHMREIEQEFFPKGVTNK